MVIIISDGIYDVFDTSAEIEEYLLQLNTQNPQTLAENILKSALDKSGTPKDDMTVLCARLFNVF